jgi:site-specific recombinase XerD
MKYENISQIKEYFDVLRLDKSQCTIDSYSISVTKFFDYLHINTFEDVADVTTKNCRDFQAELRNQGLEKSSVNAYTRPLKVVFNWLQENEYIVESPWQKVKFLKQEKKVVAFLSPEEYNKMLVSCNKNDDKLIFSLLLTTGMRRNELISLKLSDYNGSHILVHGKGSKQRVLQLMPEVCKLLDQYLEVRTKKYPNCDALLVSKMGRAYCGQSILDRIHQIGLKAGIQPERLDKIHVHTTRHTFASNLVSSGADIRVVQGAMGHANLSTTMLYAHLRNSALDNAMLNQNVSI